MWQNRISSKKRGQKYIDNDVKGWLTVTAGSWQNLLGLGDKYILI